MRRYVRDPELLARVDRLVSQNLVFDPQRYAADRSLRRMVDVGSQTENNQYRKFARDYPEPTETSFELLGDSGGAPCRLGARRRH